MGWEMCAGVLQISVVSGGLIHADHAHNCTIYVSPDSGVVFNNDGTSRPMHRKTEA